MHATKFKDFLDTNVVLYLLSGDADKADQVERLLVARPVISVQVLNEVTQVCRRKLRMDWAEIAEFLSLVRGFCKVVPITEAIHDHAREIAERYKFSFYDACILAAAATASCKIVFSEDMQNGQALGDILTLRNPFIPQ